MHQSMIRFTAMAVLGMLVTASTGAVAAVAPPSKPVTKRVLKLIPTNAIRFADMMEARNGRDGAAVLTLDSSAGLPGSFEDGRRLPPIMAQARAGDDFWRDDGRLDDDRRHWLAIASFVANHDFITPSAVPEADIAWMLALGLPLTLWAARRKRPA